MWSDAIKQLIIDELEGYDVYFSPAEVPPDVDFPWQWGNFGPANDKNSCTPIEWVKYAEHLPWVYDWIDKCVLGTVLAVKDKSYLMYVYKKEDDLNFYMGGVPLGASNKELDKFACLPEELKNFYRDLHNGFGFFIGCAMGPSQVEDFVSIKDLCDEDYPNLPDMISFFSSGAGDYLALEKGAWKGELFIWWHEEPDAPTRKEDLWGVMDEWMSIFLEDSEVVR